MRVRSSPMVRSPNAWRCPKASAVAAAADAQLGQVLTASETGAPSIYPPMPYDTAVTGAEAAASIPVKPPTLETQISVQVTWELI